MNESSEVTGSLHRLVVAIALFAVVSMGLIAWAHLGWEEAERNSLIPLDSLSVARRAVLTAEVFAERRLAGDGSITEGHVVASLDRAIAAIRSVREGSGGFAYGAMVGVHNPSLSEAVRAYEANLNFARDRILAYLTRHEPLGRLDLRSLYGELERASNAVESELLHDLRRRRTLLDYLAAALIASVALFGGAVLGALYHTERRRERAARALGLSEGTLRAFASSVPGVSFMMNRSGLYVGVFGNDNELLAAPRESLVGRNLREIFPAPQADFFLGVVNKALDTGRTQQCEYELSLPTGPRWFEARVSAAGEPDVVVWLGWDVTDRKRAEARVRALTRLYGFLGTVNQSIVWISDRNALLRAICDVAVSSGGFNFAWFTWLSQDAKRLDVVAFSAHGTAIDPALLGEEIGEIDEDSASTNAKAESPAARVMREGSMQLVPDIAVAQWQARWREAALVQGNKTYVAIPVRERQQCIGVLNLLGAHLDADGSEELALLREVGVDVSFALTQIAKDAEQRRAEERIRLHAAALESTRDGVIVTDLSDRIVSVNRAFSAITGYEESEVIGQTPAVLKSHRHGEDFYHALWEHTLNNGSWQGEVWNRRKNGDLYPQWTSISTVFDDKGQPSHYVTVFTDITQIKEAEQRLNRLAHFDPLTDLPNRAMILSQLTHALARAERTAGRVGVMFFDLDNFKNVNDALGHAQGDELLIEVGRRITGRMRRQDALGRLGGDEFVLVLEDVHEPQDCAGIAQDLIDTLSAPYLLSSGHTVYVQASVGISLYPDDARLAPDLVRAADAAMYQAKRAGRSTYRYYTESLTVAANARLAMEERLRKAVENDEFELHFQPLTDIRDGRLTGVEALARLREKSGGETGREPLKPEDFIPLLEETGMIVELGTKLMRTACRQGKAWLEEGHRFGTLSINVSLIEIARGGFPDRLAAILQETGFPPDLLELEVTESALTERSVQSTHFIEAIGALGVRLTIDDFGSAYSSLAYLKGLPVRRLKIDTRFIRNIPEDVNNTQLVGTIIDLAHALELDVQAKGVETGAQMSFLRERGCDGYQGHLFSEALPADAFAQRHLRG